MLVETVKDGGVKVETEQRHSRQYCQAHVSHFISTVTNQPNAPNAPAD